MNSRLVELQHELHSVPAVYFVLGDPLDKSKFDAVVSAFVKCGAQIVDHATQEMHWDALQERAAGLTPWGQLVPRYAGPDNTIEGIRGVQASVHSLDNILTVRPYSAFELDSVLYTLDMFNPCDELQLGYAGAGEPVLLLLMRGREPAVTRDRLISVASFYELVAALDRILSPLYIRAARSFAPIAIAYAEGRFPTENRPWELLFDLSVLDRAFDTIPPELNGWCAKVEAWSGARTLVQVLPGLSARLAAEYVHAARALGMTAVQELIPGGYSRMPRRPSDSFSR